jgi:hypothetical protein
MSNISNIAHNIMRGLGMGLMLCMFCIESSTAQSPERSGRDFELGKSI